MGSKWLAVLAWEVWEQLQDKHSRMMQNSYMKTLSYSNVKYTTRVLLSFTVGKIECNNLDFALFLAFSLSSFHSHIV